MASSGTYTFAPSTGELTLSAFARLGIRRPQLLAEHMADAKQEMNFLLSSWSNLAPNLWTVDLVSTTLVAGTASYSVAARTVMILDAYLSYGSPSTDHLIFPISRSEYASYPSKTTQGTPTVYWFDRLTSPTITLWTVPDSAYTYTLNYYRCTQNEDANLPSGETPAVPYRWLDALVAGLAHRLARIYKPDLEQARAADADKAWAIAATQDTENVPMAVTPMLSGYYRT